MKCPADGCERQISTDRFGCSRHWFMLPKALRERVWDRWYGRSDETYDDLVTEAQGVWAGR